MSNKQITLKDIFKPKTNKEIYNELDSLKISKISTIIHIFVRHGFSYGIKKMFDKNKIDIQKDINFELFLEEACNKNFYKTAKELVERGADPYKHTNNSVLSLAASHEDLKLLKFLISKTSYINNIDYFRLLHIASYTNNIKLLRYILKFDIGEEIHSYYNPFSDACKNEYIEFVRILIDEAWDKINNIEKQRGLLEACKKDNYELIKLLIENDVKCTAVAFSNACKNGNMDAITLLVDNCINPIASYNMGLKEASKVGHIEIVKYLIDKGTDINYNNSGSFIWAVKKKHINIVKLLLKNGANIQANDNLSLKTACEKGNEYVDIVKLLLENGADLSVNNYFPIRIAFYKNHKHIIKLISKYVNIMDLFIK